MKNLLASMLAGAALMGCTPASEPTPAPQIVEPSASAPSTTPEPMPQPPATDPAADACGAAQYAAMVGKPISAPGIPAEGPNVRYIRPDTQVTMDFRADRLNVDIDANEVITGFRCA